LNPPRFQASIARAVSGSGQVGYAYSAGFGAHAILWHGTADSAVDLHPMGFDETAAKAIAGGTQVGYARGPATGGMMHAVVWHSTAESMIDLHPYVAALRPASVRSEATGVDANGDIVGFANEGNNYFAVKWSLVPEPNASVLFACGATLAFGGRRCHRGRRTRTGSGNLRSISSTR
jgi:hypothetical protein